MGLVHYRKESAFWKYLGLNYKRQFAIEDIVVWERTGDIYKSQINVMLRKMNNIRVHYHRGVTPSYGPAKNVCATVLGLVFVRFWSETGYVLHFGLAVGILFTTNSFFPRRHWQIKSPSRIFTAQTLREDRGTYINVFLRKWNLILVSCGHIGYRILAQL